MKLDMHRRAPALATILVAVLGLMAGNYHCFVMGLAPQGASSAMSCHADASEPGQKKSCCLPSAGDEQAPPSQGLNGPCCTPASNVLKPTTVKPVTLSIVDIAIAPIVLEPAAPAEITTHARVAEDRAGPPDGPERSPRSSRAPPLT